MFSGPSVKGDVGGEAQSVLKPLYVEVKAVYGIT